MFLLLFTRGRRVGTPNQSREQGSDSSDSGSTLYRIPQQRFSGTNLPGYFGQTIDAAFPTLIP